MEIPDVKYMLQLQMLKVLPSQPPVKRKVVLKAAKQNFYLTIIFLANTLSNAMKKNKDNSHLTSGSVQILNIQINYTHT